MIQCDRPWETFFRVVALSVMFFCLAVPLLELRNLVLLLLSLALHARYDELAARMLPTLHN